MTPAAAFWAALDKAWKDGRRMLPLDEAILADQCGHVLSEQDKDRCRIIGMRYCSRLGACRNAEAHRRANQLVDEMEANLKLRHLPLPEGRRARLMVEMNALILEWRAVMRCTRENQIRVGLEPS